MKVVFDNVLVCDVRKITFEDKTYFSLDVYQDGRLYRISIPRDSVKTFKEAIGQTITLDTEMRIYDGKSKFRIAQ